MTTTSVQDIDVIVSQMGRFAGSMRDLTTDISKSTAQTRLERDMSRRAIANHTKSLMGLTSSYKEASTVLASFIGGGLVGKAVTGLMSKGAELTKTYRELAASGNTFGGSILNMAQAAAQAGLPLDEFANATKKNAMVAGAMGKNWTKFQLEMRKGMVAHGNFNMSMEEVTEFSGKFLDTYRKSGAATQMSGDKMVALANVTTNLSAATHKARDEIAELAVSAIDASTAAASIKALPEAMRGAATAQLQTVTSIFASQAGEAGDFLSRFFTDTVGRGSAVFTEQGKSLISAGLGGVVMEMDKLGKTKTVDGAVDAINNYQSALAQNYNTLQALANSNGESASAAQQQLKIYEQLQKLSAADIKKQAERQDNATKFFLVIETMWNQVMGNFQQGFLKGFKPLFDSAGDITKSKTFEKFGTMMAMVGEKMGLMISGLFTEKNITRIGDGLSKLADGLVSFPWGAVFGTLAAAAGLLGKTFEAVGDVAQKLHDIFGSWKAVAAGFIGVFAGFKTGIFQKMFGGGKEMVIRTARIIMEGGGMGGGGGGDSSDAIQDLADAVGGQKKERSPHAAQGSKLGRKYRQGYLKAKHREGKGRVGAHLSGMKMAGSMMLEGVKSSIGLKTGAKLLSKEALKSGIKKIPVIGALTGIGFAAKRAMSGDWLGGAMELASGVAGTIPGVGTVASLGIDAAIAARDGKKWSEGIKDNLPDDDAAMPTNKTKKSKLSAGLAATGGLATGAGLMTAYEALMGDDDDDDDGSSANGPKNNIDNLVASVEKLAKLQQETQNLLVALGSTSKAGSKDIVDAISKLMRS